MPTTLVDISVVITTYNRADMLGTALQALLRQKGEGLRYEIVVVDNNSSDNTRATVENFIASGRANLRYVFEPKQGISHGRNAGIAAARGEIIAFTDDDVVTAENWLTTIRQAFAAHPSAGYIGGKILPHWTEPPPSWLTVHHWWPLALLDAGDEPFAVNAANALCLPTANAAFRRNVFSKVGPYLPEFSGREDHEMYLRLWQAGIEGMYVPELVVTATVQPERYQKAYHRNWNRRTGEMNSLMRLDERSTRDGGVVPTERVPRGVTLFGVPLSIYRQFVTESVAWLGNVVTGRDESEQLQHENRLFYLAGYVSKRYEVATTEQNYSRGDDVASFVRGIFARRTGKPVPSND
jgi:glycosyltransferase involved in cell wall biosynthesis